MILHAFGVLEQERSQTAAAILIQPIEEFGHGPTGHDGQVAAKDHTVETRQYAMNPILIFADEFFHGSNLLTLGLLLNWKSFNKWEVSVKDFRKLLVWEKGHQLTLAIYRVTTAFPSEETYGLTSQMRRAAASIPSNIAEGCGRDGDAELARFCTIARGSASELEYQILLSRDLQLIQPDDYERLTQQAVEIKRMLTVLVQKLNAEKLG